MKLKDWLKDKRMTQAAFAQQVNRSEVYIQKIIAGRKPGADTALLIVEHTDGMVSLNDLYNISDKTPEGAA